MEYVLLTEDDEKRLTRKVNEKLNDGWELFGPPSGATHPYGNGKIYFLQALTRDN